MRGQESNREKQEEDEDDLFYQLLLRPINCLILQDWPSENYRKCIILQSIKEEKGESLPVGTHLSQVKCFPYCTSTHHSQLYLDRCMAGS